MCNSATMQRVSCRCTVSALVPRFFCSSRRRRLPTEFSFRFSTLEAAGAATTGKGQSVTILLLLLLELFVKGDETFFKHRFSAEQCSRMCDGNQDGWREMERRAFFSSPFFRGKTITWKKRKTCGTLVNFVLFLQKRCRRTEGWVCCMWSRTSFCGKIREKLFVRPALESSERWLLNFYLDVYLFTLHGGDMFQNIWCVVR